MGQPQWRSFIKWIWGQGDLSRGHGALSRSVSPCWAWWPAQPLGKDLLGKDGLRLCTRLAHAPA